MKNRKGLMFVVFGLLFFSSVYGWGPDWKFYANATKGTINYYDGANITRPSKGIVRVWNKLVPGDEDILEYVERLGNKYKHLSYSLLLWEHHCVEKKHRIFSAIN